MTRVWLLSPCPKGETNYNLVTFTTLLMPVRLTNLYSISPVQTNSVETSEGGAGTTGSAGTLEKVNEVGSEVADAATE